MINSSKFHCHTMLRYLNTVIIPFGGSTRALMPLSSHFEHGLADSPSEAAFRLALENVKEKWNNLERSCKSGESAPLLHSWFKEHKAENIRCVLPDVRHRAGLNNPLALFTTNCSESLNNVIKWKLIGKRAHYHCLWSICSLLEIAKMQSWREQ